MVMRRTRSSAPSREASSTSHGQGLPPATLDKSRYMIGCPSIAAKIGPQPGRTSRGHVRERRHGGGMKPGGMKSHPPVSGNRSLGHEGDSAATPACEGSRLREAQGAGSRARSDNVDMLSATAEPSPPSPGCSSPCLVCPPRRACGKPGPSRSSHLGRTGPRTG